MKKLSPLAFLVRSDSDRSLPAGARLYTPKHVIERKLLLQ
jgi:hypothetical protein